MSLSDSTFSLRRNQWECPHTEKGKKNFGYAFVQNQLIDRLFSLQVLYILDSVSSLLRSLAEPCDHPGSMNSASWCALSNSSANTTFSGQRNPLEEGEGSRGHGGGLVGGC